MGKVAIVTGGSSGIGKQAAEYLRSHDCIVYELSRRGEDRRGIRHITADVTDEASVNAAVAQVFAAEGRIGNDASQGCGYHLPEEIVQAQAKLVSLLDELARHPR